MVLDGTNVEDVITTELSDSNDIALYTTAEKMYWTDIYGDKIYCANLDGTNVEYIVTGLVNPGDIALHLMPLIEEQPPAWDVNGDGIMDILDLVMVVLHFGESGNDVVGDVNGDGIADIADLVLLGSHLGESITATESGGKK